MGPSFPSRYPPPTFFILPYLLMKRVNRVRPASIRHNLSRQESSLPIKKLTLVINKYIRPTIFESIHIFWLFIYTKNLCINTVSRTRIDNIRLEDDLFTN